MHREIPNVTLAKVETPSPVGKIAALVEAAGPGLLVLGGLAGSFLLEELAAGARGTMPAALMPEVYAAILRAHASGDPALGRRIYHAVSQPTSRAPAAIPWKSASRTPAATSRPASAR